MSRNHVHSSQPRPSLTLNQYRPNFGPFNEHVCNIENSYGTDDQVTHIFIIMMYLRQIIFLWEL